MFEFIQQLLNFVHYHPNWAILLSFVIAFVESIAVLGLFIPGSTILALMGGLIGAQILEPTGIIIAAVTGAILGDSVSYGLGYYYHAKIRSLWPFNRFTMLLNKGEIFFMKHGGKSLFAARFFGPLRGIIPVIAGMLRFSPIRFIVANIISALVWAPGYILFGILVGHQIELVHPHHLHKLFAQIIVGSILFWLVYYLARSKVIQGFHFVNAKLKGRHQDMQSYFLKNLLRDNHMPYNHRQLSTLVLALSLSILFLVLLDLILGGVQFTSVNHPLYQSLQALSSTLSVHVMTVISLLGDKKILIPISVLFSLFLFFQNQKRFAAHFLGLILVTTLSASLIKHFVHFVRPPAAALLNLGYSFPSGHAILAVVFWGFLGFVLLQKKMEHRRKTDIKALMIFIILSVCLSRLFLGVHWFTDVLGSLLLGLAYLNFTILSYRRGRHHSLNTYL